MPREDLVSNFNHFIDRIDIVQKNNFISIQRLSNVQNLEVVAFKSEKLETEINSKAIEGIVAFSKDDKTQNVTVYNIFVVNKENMSEIFDQAFKYIFEITKCT